MQMSHNWQHALTKQRAVEDLHHGKVGTLIWSIITAKLMVIVRSALVHRESEQVGVATLLVHDRLGELCKGWHALI
jgi:hypothetical protein